MSKLNSMRILDAAGIAYQVLKFDLNEHDDEHLDAATVARLVGVPVEQVYKTLVVLPASGGTKPSLVMISADRQLDLKKFAASIGQKKMVMATHAAAEKLTGLKVGGIGALALTHKHWDVYLDKTAESLDQINVSAGQRGINLRLAVRDIIRVTEAKIVEATVIQAMLDSPRPATQ
jgi:Cys-tRNA(Pro)/Cys-tRNA(Cys) deacylase